MSEQFIYSQKNNFSAGELTPTIEGRTELGLYQNGAKKLSNFIILPSGGIVRRHGTRFVHLFKDNVLRKIISVMFSRELSYLLVFEAHIDKTVCLFFVDGNLFLTSKIIKDDAGRDFHFKLKNFSYTCFQGVAYISFGIDRSNIDSPIHRPIFKFSVDPKIVNNFYQHLAKNDNPQSASTTTVATSFAGKDAMFIIEPLKAHVAYYKQMQNNVEMQRPFNEVIYNADIDKINDVLKGLHATGAANIYEQKQEKLYATSIVTFENRLWCFGVNKNMHLIWASYKGDFYDFRMSYKTLLEARNPLTAFSATFSSATFDNVLWTVPFSTELLLGTTDGIYLIKEGDRGKGEFIKIHKELDVPVSPIKPVIIGKTIFFVDGSERKINSLYYSQEKGGFQLSDVTAYADHIANIGIRQIVGINSPFSMLFVVLKDGTFSSFTYSQDLKIMGWTPDFLGGNNAVVLSITPIYSEDEDKLFFHVRRSDDIGSGYKEYLECLHPKYFIAKNNEMHKPVYLDCYVDITRPEEARLDHAIKQAIKNDSGLDSRGDTTKLENLVQVQAANILKLNVDINNIPNNFKVNNRLVSGLPANVQAPVKLFLQKYYKDQMPLIMEFLASCFAFYRLIDKIYSILLNIFSNETEDLHTAKQILNDAERLSNDIAIILNNITSQNLRIPAGINSSNGDTGLCFSNREIRDDEAIALAKVLKNNNFITSLDLMNNQIGDKGAIALAKVLKNNNFITSLDLMNNQIGDKGAIALAKALKNNNSIIELLFNNNQIGDKGAIALAKALKNNNSITWLSFVNNQIGDKGTIALAEVIKNNNFIDPLLLDSNKIGDKGAIALAEALKNNNSITDLCLNQQYTNQTENQQRGYIYSSYSNPDQTIKLYTGR